MLVYDITKKDSFNNITKEWLKDLKTQGEPDCIMMLIGNKVDLNHLRQVDTSEGKKMAMEHNMMFLETSARDNSNVDIAFETLVKGILWDNFLSMKKFINKERIPIDKQEIQNHQ